MPSSRGSSQPVCLGQAGSSPLAPPGKSFRVTAAAAAAKSLQLCPTLCDPIDGSPPDSAVPGILQARTLEWVAISFSTSPQILYKSSGSPQAVVSFHTMSFLDTVTLLMPTDGTTPTRMPAKGACAAANPHQICAVAARACSPATSFLRGSPVLLSAGTASTGATSPWDIH